MGTWDDAERFRLEHPDPPKCPFCRSDAIMIELVDQSWLCNVCSKHWPVVTRNDQNLMKRYGIDPS